MPNSAIQGDFIMNCANHAEVQNAAFCSRCGKALCAECVRNVRGSVYCETCLGEFIDGKAPGAGPEKKRVEMLGGYEPGTAFVLGLIPGVGAIYNADYFKAAIHILVFGILVSIASVEDSRAAGPLFTMLSIGFYFYMAFEAYYTAKKFKLRSEGIELETPFDRFNQQFEAVRNKEIWGAGFLIVMGVLFLLDNFDVIRMDRVARLWPLILIALGVWILRFRGKAA
jgi:hypothetical protein